MARSVRARKALAPSAKSRGPSGPATSGPGGDWTAHHMFSAKASGSRSKSSSSRNGQ